MSDVTASESVGAPPRTAVYRRARAALVLGIVGVAAPAFFVLAIEGPDDSFGTAKGLAVGAIVVRALALTVFRGIWSVLALVLGRRARGDAAAGAEANMAYAAIVLGWLGLALSAVAVVRLVLYLAAWDGNLLFSYIDWPL